MENNRISRNPRPIVNESALPNVNSVPQPNVVYANSPNIIQTLQNLDVPESQTASATVQTTPTPITANNPVNGALATLATLGIITAGAGAITMTATALAKKREQDELKSAQMATLQAQQSAQAQSAGANWAENQAMQANAKQAVVTQVTQSQANKDFWASYVLWKLKVALLEAKRRLQYLPKEQTSQKQVKPKQKDNSLVFKRLNPLALLLGVVVIGTSLLLGTVQYQNDAKPEEFDKPNSQAGSECYKQLAQFSGFYDDAFCTAVSAIEVLLNIEQLSQNLSNILGSIGGTSSNEYVDDQLANWTPFSGIMTEDLVRIINNRTNPDLEEPLQYYFRGTTRGYLGNQVLQDLPATPTSTQPGVATVFATEAETTHSQEGVVYIASSNDLEGVAIRPSNYFSHYEFEIVFTITPEEFAQRASICILASEARRILNSLGMNISSRINNEGLSGVLEDLAPLDETRIRLFVLYAFVAPRC